MEISVPEGARVTGITGGNRVYSLFGFRGLVAIRKDSAKR